MSQRFGNISRWSIPALGLLVLALGGCRANPQAMQQGPGGYGGMPMAGPMMAGPMTAGPMMGLGCVMPVEAGDCGAGCPMAPLSCGAGAACRASCDEYVCDGGDGGLPALVAPDWTVYGLEPTDTVAHYDTLDGQTLVEPSNTVCLYAPRFGAVRVVRGPDLSEQVAMTGGINQPLKVIRQDEIERAATGTQEYQPTGQIGTRMPSNYQMNMGDGALSSRQHVLAYQDRFLPFEDFLVIRTGIFQQNEKAALAVPIQAALTWSSNQAVQVTINRQNAVAAVRDQHVETVYTVKDFRHSPKLRVIKVASTQNAHPGELVDFTIRFDNVGDQTIGNVVLLDHLVTRLEFVPDSAQASVGAQFTATPGDDGTTLLRWEVDNELKVGDGGLVRFQARVR